MSDEFALKLRMSNEALQVIRHLSRLLVGQMSLKDAQRALRTTMSQEALLRCGSRRAAAAMLGVDRRYVQRLACESSLCDEDDVTTHVTPPTGT
jgi:hypothetical protein